jgi:hypothetical protein
MSGSGGIVLAGVAKASSPGPVPERPEKGERRPAIVNPEVLA